MDTPRIAVLVVDDEPDYASTLALALRADGMSAESVTAAEQALERLSDPEAAQPDLMITDIVMPGMSGEELVVAARRIAPDMPILAMTAFGDKQMVIRLMRSGCSDYIEKPFTTEELQKHIRPLVARRSTTLDDEDTRTIRRLAAIGRNVAGFVHDVNNQLAAMNGFGELLADGLTDPRRVEYCNALRKCFYRVGNMANSVMAAASAGSPAAVMQEQIPAREMIDNIVALSNLRTRDIRVSVKTDCVVWGHRARVEAALWNLLKNADEALIGRRDAAIEVRCSCQGNYAVIAVIDNGPGISGQIRSRLFGLGQTFGKTKGNGIGLYSARRAVEAMGGQLWCESEPGKGAAFMVKLPMFAPSQALDSSGARAPDHADASL